MIVVIEKQYGNQLKKSKLLCAIISVIAVLLLAVIVISCINVQRQNRIVGYIEGNILHYNGMIYAEVSKTDSVEPGRCLGSVEWRDADTPYSSKIYKVKSTSDAIYLSMGTDHRIYEPSDKDQ